jgi:hypothetical protein
MRVVTRLAVAAAVLGTMHYARAQETDIHWHHLYEKAVEEAQQTGKPLFVAFRCVP